MGGRKAKRVLGHIYQFPGANVDENVPVCATDQLGGSVVVGNGTDGGGSGAAATRSGILIGASRNENVEIPCHIAADPPARSFHWRFNNSAEILQVDAHRFTNQGNISILNYAPVTDQDFGTLTCWAVNEVGPQSQPCTFQLVLADLPAPVSNCSLPNRTQQLVEIQCTAGYDGGLPQMFVLELISKRTGTRRFNFSNKNEPFFVLDRLEKLSALMTLENNSLSCVVYALNQKGRSTPVLIQDFEIGRIQPYRAETKRVDALEWLPIAGGILLTVIILALSISTKTYLTRWCWQYGRWCGCWPRATGSETKRGDPNGKSEHQTHNILRADEFECGTHCLKLKNVQMLRRHSSRKKNTSKDSNDDEPEPDVIPAQFNIVSASPLLSTPQHNETTAKDSLRYGAFSPAPISYQASTVVLANHDTNYHTSITAELQQGPVASIPPAPSLDALEYRAQGSIVGILPSTRSGPGPGPGSSELDINVIKDRLLTTRVPESCV
ncbi:hypothetical protein ZHAS_00009036 [Anopheles sinensis]|uniref:Ig-like domain-containing protein n=1 Tax=Anopheles sinensis TaxID=74873 RepID=A0A084VTZ7_ANOSI|nr:hypothetical protein ZHAS_00009036 [Anopheles sinensis]